MRVVDEAERIRVVASYDVEGMREAGALDDLTAFAAALCDTPVALVTLVEEEYQRFVARTGTAEEGTPRSISFCTHALHSADLTEFPDLLADPRFVDNPLVTGGPEVRFYAGMPLMSSEGAALGTFCVLDVVARPGGLSALQRQGLVVLARAAMGRLDDRRAAREQGVIEAKSRRALEQSDLRFRVLADAMPQMVWSTRPDGFHDYYNARWYAFTGVPAGSTDGEGWAGLFHADDQPRAWERWRHSLDTGEPYEVEYRLKYRDGTYRWVLGRALCLRDDAGAITRWFGTCTDIHEQRMAQDEREVIAQELSHRIKNIFAVISGLIAFAARSRPDFAPLATDLRERITALGRAHDFVRPHSARSRPMTPQDSLRGLLGDLFAPYEQEGGDRILVTGDEVAIDDRSATPMALLFHELATNATKYGALSTEDGRVAVTIRRDQDWVAIDWVERGGPAIERVAEPSGFGSQLIELSAVRQLGGTVTRDWRREGLALSVAVPRAALAR